MCVIFVVMFLLAVPLFIAQIALHAAVILLPILGVGILLRILYVLFLRKRR